MNEFPPFSYAQENSLVSRVSPNTIHACNTALSRFFARYLFQRLLSVVKIDCPETWDVDYFQTILFGVGYIAILRTDKYGVIPQSCTIGDLGIFYQPTRAIINNPLFKRDYELTIWKDCGLLKLQFDYGSSLDLVMHYADQMAMIVEGIDVNIFNSKLAYVFSAAKQPIADSYKKMFDQISSGNPMSVVDKSLFNADGTKNWEIFNANISNTYIADKMLSDLRKIVAMFDSDVGIPNSNLDKKERMISDEVNANNIETYCLMDSWLDRLQRDCAKVKKMFGIDIKIDWRFRPNFKGGEKDANSKNVSDGNVQL